MYMYHAHLIGYIMCTWRERQLEAAIVHVDRLYEAAADLGARRPVSARQRSAESCVAGEEPPTLLGQRARAVAAVVDGTLERGKVGKIAEPRRHPYDGERRGGRGGGRRGWGGARRLVLLEDGVCVSACGGRGVVDGWMVGWWVVVWKCYEGKDGRGTFSN